MLDAAADYPFVNQTKFIEFNLISLSFDFRYYPIQKWSSQIYSTKRSLHWSEFETGRLIKFTKKKRYKCSNAYPNSFIRRPLTRI